MECHKGVECCSFGNAAPNLTNFQVEELCGRLMGGSHSNAQENSGWFSWKASLICFVMSIYNKNMRSYDIMFFFPLWERSLNQFLETTAKEDHMCISTYQRSLDWNPLKAVDQLIRFVEADLNLLLTSIKNWMGPYQRTPFKKLLQLLDTHVFAGSVDRGSCWRFLGFEILTLLSLWKLKGKNHPKVSTLPGWTVNSNFCLLNICEMFG